MEIQNPKKDIGEEIISALKELNKQLDALQEAFKDFKENGSGIK